MIQTIKLDPVELMPEIAAAPTSIEAHLYRLAVLGAVLDRFSDSGLPEIEEWKLDGCSTLDGHPPLIQGRLGYTLRLADARSQVAAWARALDTSVTETLHDFRRLEIEARAEAGGIPFHIVGDVYLTQKCEGCSGPGADGEIVQHFVGCTVLGGAG